jgi:hypothetical protein
MSSIRMVALYALWYNFVRIHKTLRTSPAMAAGIESRLWSMEDVVAMIDARSTSAARRWWADFSEDGTGLWRWFCGLLSARRDKRRVEQAERYFEPDHRRQLDESARSAARAAESGVTSVPPMSGP